MNRDDIIRMAKQAGIPFNKYKLVGCDFCERDIDDELERFAKLIAAAERKAFAKIQFDSILQGVRIEREACAKLCDSEPSRDCGEYGQVSDAIACAEAIRARG